MKQTEIVSLLKEKMTVQNYALDTVKAYSSSVNNFLSFLIKTPDIMKETPERRIEAYLTHRVEKDDISPSTQNVEFNALIFLHRKVLGLDVNNINALRARPRLRVPPILTRDHVTTIINSLPESNALIGYLLYGTGMRLNEVLRLRIKDVDFENQKIIVHQAKGDKERILPLPLSLHEKLSSQVQESLKLWEIDRSNGHGVHLPRALEKKYKTIHLSKEWYWVFPTKELSVDPRSKRVQRHHIKDFTVQRAFSDVRKSKKLPAYATPHSLRHAFATHLAKDMLGKGFPQDMVEAKLMEYLGHVSRETLKFYVHLSAPEGHAVVLPIETMTIV